MFGNNFSENTNTLVFIGGFHLGIPLSFAYTDGARGWGGISIKLREEYLKLPDKFILIEENYEPETKFPLGNPIKLKYKPFTINFKLLKYFEDMGVSIKENNIVIDNEIWILPTNVVLIIGSVSFNQQLISLTEFEDNIIENHYADLSYLFLEVARPIFSLIPEELFNSAITCNSDLNNISEAIEKVNSFECSEDYISGKSSISEKINQDSDFESTLSNILVDVYYFDYQHSKSQSKFRIGYVDSEIIADNPLFVFVISIAYSSFVGFLWIVKHLSEQSRLLQEAMIGKNSLYDDISHDLKLFRIFCLRFINDSSPINIRLTGYYMEKLEECWKQYRLHELRNQVNEQLQTLEKMFDWIDNEKKENRNFKIGLAAILLALISLLAVSAQLVSTIDFANTISWPMRAILIGMGFVIGIFSTIYISRVQNFKNWVKSYKHFKLK